MDEREKNCANCKNFKRYYTLNVCFRFTPTDKGYCVKRKMRKDGSKLDVERNETCDMWQSNELQIINNRYTAVEVLRDISKKLEAIRGILGDDGQ